MITGLSEGTTNTLHPLVVGKIVSNSKSEVFQINELLTNIGVDLVQNAFILILLRTN